MSEFKPGDQPNILLAVSLTFGPVVAGEWWT